MDGTMTSKYVCCFCGQTIEPEGFDVGSLLYTTNIDGPRERQREQDLFCHASCLVEKTHPSIRQYLLPLALEPDIGENHREQLPDFLRHDDDATQNSRSSTSASLV